MKKLQWDMEEVFYFPEGAGVPKEARTVKVKAGFTEKRSEDAVRLSGIYHIAAKVDFMDGERLDTIPSEAVFVDDVEMDGGAGYFEYAVPLYVDLPPDVDQPLHLEATDVKTTFDGHGSFKVTWNVNCTYGASDAENQTTDAAAVNDDTNAELKDERTETAKQEQTETADKAPAVTQNAPTDTLTASAAPTAQTAPAAPVAEAVAAQDTPQVNEKSIAVSNERVEQKKTASTALVQKAETTALHHSSSWNDHDDMLAYIAGLPDEWTTTSFRSNDILVKEKS